MGKNTLFKNSILVEIISFTSSLPRVIIDNFHTAQLESLIASFRAGITNFEIQRIRMII